MRNSALLEEVQHWGRHLGLVVATISSIASIGLVMVSPNTILIGKPFAIYCLI